MALKDTINCGNMLLFLKNFCNLISYLKLQYNGRRIGVKNKLVVIIKKYLLSEELVKSMKTKNILSFYTTIRKDESRSVVTYWASCHQSSIRGNLKLFSRSKEQHTSFSLKII